MLEHPTLEKLASLRLLGMLAALSEQMSLSEYQAFSFEERLGLLVDREVIHRENRKLALRMKRATLRQDACIEDIDFRHPRGMDRSVVLSLASCQWINNRRNCLIRQAFWASAEARKVLPTPVGPVEGYSPATCASAACSASLFPPGWRAAFCSGCEPSNRWTFWFWTTGA